MTAKSIIFLIDPIRKKIIAVIIARDGKGCILTGINAFDNVFQLYHILQHFGFKNDGVILGIDRNRNFARSNPHKKIFLKIRNIDVQLI